MKEERKYHLFEVELGSSPTVFRLPAAAGVDLNVIGFEAVISPSVPARRGGLGLFLPYFDCVS
jgi:hypothetical protein